MLYFPYICLSEEMHELDGAEHPQCEQPHRIIKEVVRVLKPGGKFVAVPRSDGIPAVML
ncbi:class I SAM-dependent methyltransferase [Paenibacillus hemerocallicola]|uniref:Class I SAM-dependent methyltransferase n=1 Tax=Paenibacillus hemerocallicola TaxID=1172614 RepID=A0A5C4SYP7_9BACL|nr:class I SAM-dependent methyltransferase [Paenibacillus hemerocallicola]